MKTRAAPGSRRDAGSSVPGRLAVVMALVLLALVGGLPLLLAAPVPAYKPAEYPAWWFERGVIPQTTSPPSDTPAWPADYRAPDDYAAANLGQLKHLATQADAELNAHLPGGAGAEIDNLVAAWSAAPATGITRDDFAALNLGQLKSVNPGRKMESAECSMGRPGKNK